MGLIHPHTYTDTMTYSNNYNNYRRFLRKCYFGINYDIVKGEGIEMLKKIIFGMMLTLLLIDMLTLAFNIKPAKGWTGGTIYIRADGSIDPSDAPIITYDNITYVLTDNIVCYADGIVVERDNIIVDGGGYTLQGSETRKGIYLSGRTGVTVKNVKIRAFGSGIFLNYSSNNIINGNDIIAHWAGIELESSLNNVISGNKIANGDFGILFSSSFNNSVSRNGIINNHRGIGLYLSSNNNISINSITYNYNGIFLASSSNNYIYHNNFINNDQQSFPVFGSENVWDDGYPSGGNYWSDYTGVDLYSGSYQNETGSDGIGDTPYVIGTNNIDRYPLLNPWSPIPVKVFDVVLEDIHFPVSIESNSTITHFIFTQSLAQISFNVSGSSEVIGYCNVSIPMTLLKGEPWTVKFNGKEWGFTSIENGTHSFIYFTYTHASTYKVTIQGTWVVPEFPSAIILPLFIFTTLIAAVLLKKKRKQNPNFPNFP
ncbi:MAG: NosD domain-containing protein [Candidatus Bathyarchaeia archaeon]